MSNLLLLYIVTISLFTSLLISVIIASLPPQLADAHAGRPQGHRDVARRVQEEHERDVERRGR